MPSMLEKAALHFHRIDMGAGAEMRSYSYPEAKILRSNLIEAGFTEQEVDANGKLDLADYHPYASFREDHKAQLADCPDPLISAVANHLEENPEGVLMVAADSLDALLLEVEDVPRVVWVKPDGEVSSMAGTWVTLRPGSPD